MAAWTMSRTPAVSRPFQPPRVVEHLDHVGHQHVVVRVRVTGPGGGVPGPPVDQTGRGGADLALASSAALLGDPGVEEGEGGVGLGVEDPVHVIGPADHAEDGDGLVGRDDQLEAGPFRVDEPCPQNGVTGTALARTPPRRSRG